MPDVSIIVPVYNGERYIREAIDSVLEQTGVDLEVVVGDNASTDGTLRCLAAYDDSRLRVMTSEKNLGVYGNLNRLVESANAPILKILCADDRILPGGLKRQLEFFLAHPEAPFAMCWSEGDMQNFSSSGKHPLIGKLPVVMQPRSALLAYAIFGNLPGSLSTVIVRRDVILAAGGFNQALPAAGDYDLWSRLAVTHAFAIQKEELINYRRHDAQMSHLLNSGPGMIAQLDSIAERLYLQIEPQDRPAFRWHYAVNLVSQYWNRAIRHLFQGGAWIVPKVWVKRKFTYSNPVCLALFVLTFSRRLGSQISSRHFVQRIYHLNAQLPTIPMS